VPLFHKQQTVCVANVLLMCCSCIDHVLLTHEAMSKKIRSQVCSKMASFWGEVGAEEAGGRGGRGAEGGEGGGGAKPSSGRTNGVHPGGGGGGIGGGGEVGV
jgi:hypothetical protein